MCHREVSSTTKALDLRKKETGEKEEKRVRGENDSTLEEREFNCRYHKQKRQRGSPEEDVSPDSSCLRKETEAWSEGTRIQNWHLRRK